MSQSGNADELSPYVAGMTEVKGDPTYAWTMALIPAALIPIYYLLPEVQLSTWMPLLALGVTSLVLAGFDSARLQRLGVPAWARMFPWVLLAPIFYLTARTKHAGSTQAIPVVWLAGFAGLVVSVMTFAAVWVHPEADVEHEVQRWARSEYDARLRVDCPGDLQGAAGDSYFCEVTDGRNAAEVEVTLLDDGSYEWRAIPQ